MSVISERFADELSDDEMRHAYLSAQTRTKIANQIRVLRSQRGWSQAELGEKMGGVTQGNVSRLEDRERVNVRLETLFELAAAFDVGLVVEFLPYSEFLIRTHDLSPDHLRVPKFSRQSLNKLCHAPENRLVRFGGVLQNQKASPNNVTSAGASRAAGLLAQPTEQEEGASSSGGYNAALEQLMAGRMMKTQNQFGLAVP